MKKFSLNLTDKTTINCSNKSAVEMGRYFVYHLIPNTFFMRTAQTSCYLFLSHIDNKDNNIFKQLSG